MIGHPKLRWRQKIFQNFKCLVIPEWVTRERWPKDERKRLDERGRSPDHDERDFLTTYKKVVKVTKKVGGYEEEEIDNELENVTF